MTKKVLITAALPYANGALHFGHVAGAYLPGDCYARHQRLKGNRVLYICGTDEYGIAITLSAEMAGRSPREHVDLNHKIICDLFKRLEISFDHFSRTTWQGHVKTVQAFFLDLLEKGHIEERVTDQLYSESERRFLADRYVVGICPKCEFAEARGDECPRCGASYEATDLLKPCSKLSKAPLTKRATKHWFLRFDHFKEQLADWIKGKAWKPNVVNFAMGYIEHLKSRAISRDMDWGIPIPLPHAEGKVLYVWFDAPIGYISATQEWAEKQGHPDAWKEFWLDPHTQLVQFIGKDNIPFHAVFFPAMIMGQSLPYKLVDELPANEFLNLEGRPFSKSDGWVIDLEAVFTKFSSDQIRYVLAANAPENQDSDFSWKDFGQRCNAELVSKWGNFINRILTFAQTQCGGKVPALESLQEIDRNFLKIAKATVAEIDETYSTFQLRKTTQLIMEMAQWGNAYIDAKKPWIAAKNEATRADMLTTVACCLECIKWMALTAFPIMPTTAEKIWKMLGLHGKLSQCTWDQAVNAPLPVGEILPVPMILFNRVEEEMIQEEINRLNAPAEQTESSFISIDDVRKVDLRVVKILQVERVPKSKKLLKLTVDAGSEHRTIVAGIGEKMEDITTLIGKEIVIVANLKPATLMGVESQGMVLAATTPDGVQLPLFSNVAPGTPLS